MRVAPLGDQAVLAYCADEAAAVRLAAAVRAANPAWLRDVVPAYASVGVFFDADQVDAASVGAWVLASGGREPPESAGVQNTREAYAPRSPQTLTVPVCYEMAPDLPRVCEHTGLSADDVIRLHTAAAFTVYAVGFVPGFPYLGYLPAELCGVGRLPSPRVRVEPGSVGLTGRQTGIYPLPRPGGWNLIGRTPLTIVDVAAGFFPLRVGDAVRFTPIDDAEFRRLEGQRLQSNEKGKK
ncbi:Allophanate hydrolase subunit 1 OS=Fimbriimonas ginsengisoli Gsoil 348 GN=OP10G_2085 PE=4 SV=1: AHS1 [Gemmataceae bacterium]|nr:Allophanate hydrolase subunit 1 OS=Fimbriimonas ginsengisoli Gsoil 348 GN=OP10G_2085 PE=4 SV=1: AHS1 [Gemmataceae bacterium]VTU00468.1 Allophanate hydrolase subunit 1 OS=Fimbriimonas ginsengisoli Gsoil 348 GN=OP10G_2085 PE=4 SV=1: AHS1 [Gemmataceae bacterium]